LTRHIRQDIERIGRPLRHHEFEALLTTHCPA
jgi:hypothetical protein